MEMPQTNADLAWYGFNFLLLILVAWAKFDLSEIKNDTKKNRELQEANALKIAQIEVGCTERHKHIDASFNVLFQTKK